MSTEGPPAPPEMPELEKKEAVQVTFEQVQEELKTLKAAGVEDPEFTEDERAENFQKHLSGLDAAADSLIGIELEQYWLRRSTMFIDAGYTDPEHINEALEFLEQDLGNAEDKGDEERADHIRKLIKDCEELLPHEAEPEVPTIEKIGEALRQPGRVSIEVHAMIADWKSVRLAEVGEGAQSLVDIEMQIARLYADSGRPMDAIGSITSALIGNKAFKKMRPELKKILEDYREELKRK